MGRLENKVAIVTGGGTGIGRATAELFATEGAKVVVTGRREQPLVNTADMIRERGGQVRVVAADMTKPEDCDRVVATAREAFGPPTVLVNNAGIFEVHGKVHETPIETWDRSITINLRGPFLMMRAVIPAMLEAGSGSIVNLGSTLTQIALPGCSDYNASKSGLVMLSRSAAVEYAAQGIRCNVVCPGLTKTSMTEAVWNTKRIAAAAVREYPMGRFGEPEEIAQAILHFASDESSWTTGSVLMVDGGLTSR